MKKILFLVLAMLISFSIVNELKAQCLTGSLWPGATFTNSSCNGVPQTIVTDAWANEYSNVTVVDGNTYTFASSIGTDYITIATNEMNPTALAWGVTPVNYVATSNGTVRFYRHLSAACDAQQANRIISVSCTEPPPPVDPTFAAIPSSFNFGNTSTGDTKSQLFKIFNLGGGTLTINSSSLTGADPGQFNLMDTNTYPKDLSAGDTLFATVEFMPTSLGAKSANLTFVDNLAEAVNNIPLSGNGVQVNFGGNGQAGDNLYFFSNSTPAGGGSPSQPTYNWRTPTGADSVTLVVNKVVVSPLGAGGLDDGRFDVVGQLPVGNSIRLFGTSYTNFYIGTNGIIGFNAFTPSGNWNPPASGLPQANITEALYPLWIDLNMGSVTAPAVSRLWYEITPTEVIISYERNYVLGGTADNFVTFQVIIEHSNVLVQNSRVIYQYNFDETGADFITQYNTNALRTHLVGLQGANDAMQTMQYRFRNATTIITGGPIFGSNLALAMGPDDTALPVDLIAFNANVDRNNVELSWTTAWEENNARFDVQRRIANSDANWTTVGTVQGHGTTYEQQNYNYSDKNLVTGSYEYRLVQYDYDGNSNADFNLSQTVEVGIPTNYDLAQNYPNPFNPATKINFQIPVEGMVKLSIFDMSGREVATLVNESLTPGYYIYDFNASNFASGVYFYRITSNNFVMTKRMVLVK